MFIFRNTMTSRRPVVGPLRSLMEIMERRVFLSATGTINAPVGGSAAGTVSIMPVGDSITYGIGGTDGGYRGPLRALLLSQGIKVDYKGPVSNPADASVPDLGGNINQDGMPGAGIQEVLGNTVPWLAKGPPPDVILLDIGINDLRNYKASYPASYRTSRISTLLKKQLVPLIQNLHAAAPATIIMLSTLTDIVPWSHVDGGGKSVDGAGMKLAKEEYNRQLPQTVAALRLLMPNLKIELVNQNDPSYPQDIIHAGPTLSAPGPDISDWIHPSDAGYRKMADNWDRALEAVLAGTNSPTPTPTPAPATLLPTADAYVRDGAYASQSFGTSTVLQAKDATPGHGYRRNTYLTFNLTGVPPITSAVLELYGGETSGWAEPSITIAAYAVASTAWSQNALTFDSAPAAGSTAINSVAITGAAPKTYSLDLTSYLQQQQQLGATLVSVSLEGVNATTAGAQFNSTAAASNQPALVINAPVQPTPT